MPFYSDNLLPRILNRVMDNKMMRGRRRNVCVGLEGDVIEFGFGSGLNVPYYPGDVTGVWVIDPASIGFQLARKRLAQTTIPVHAAGLDGQRLDLPDDRFDAALSTWTLCTIPDPAAALQELLRVLKPGSPFHFVEHGLSPDDKIVRRQRRLEPIQKCVAGGCHLTRDIATLIEEAGFAIETIATSYEHPEPVGYMFQGVARKPEVASASHGAELQGDHAGRRSTR